MNTTTIYLVRHGQTEWNLIHRQQGHMDSPLTPLGGAQAKTVARLLRDLLPLRARVRVETSPLGRARATAEILCCELGVDPRSVVAEPLLIEHDMGYWQGLTHAEIEARYPGARAARSADKWNYVIPGGDSYARIAVRAKEWLGIRRDEPVTVAITHEMFSRAIQGVYAGMKPEETLARSHPQDRVYRLEDGRIAELHFDS